MAEISGKKESLVEFVREEGGGKPPSKSLPRENSGVLLFE
jgi:hypothetical protein